MTRGQEVSCKIDCKQGVAVSVFNSLESRFTVSMESNPETSRITHNDTMHEMPREQPLEINTSLRVIIIGFL